MQFIMTRRFIPLLLSLLCLAGPASSADTQLAHSSGVILLYHHVADDTPRSTSVTPDEFAQHLDYIAEHYTVVGTKIFLLMAIRYCRSTASLTPFLLILKSLANKAIS